MVTQLAIEVSKLICKGLAIKVTDDNTHAFNYLCSAMNVILSHDTGEVESENEIADKYIEALLLDYYNQKAIPVLNLYEELNSIVLLLKGGKDTYFDKFQTESYKSIAKFTEEFTAQASQKKFEEGYKNGIEKGEDNIKIRVCDQWFDGCANSYTTQDLAYGLQNYEKLYIHKSNETFEASYSTLRPLYIPSEGMFIKSDDYSNNISYFTVEIVTGIDIKSNLKNNECICVWYNFDTNKVEHEIVDCTYNPVVNDIKSEKISEDV